MNRNSSYIKKAVKEHYGAVGDDKEINPISKPDVDIINEIVEICKKVGVYEVVDIMDFYKKEADDEILQNLMEVNTNMVMNEGVDDNEDRKLPYWIHFKDTKSNRFQRQNILSFSSVDDGETIGILINECPDNASNLPLHANHMLKYYDEESREEDLYQLEDLKNY